MENPSRGPGFPSWYRFNDANVDYFFFFAAFFLAFFFAGIQSHLHSIVWVHGLRVEQFFETVKWNFHFCGKIFPALITANHDRGDLPASMKRRAPVGGARLADRRGGIRRRTCRTSSRWPA
jgi:hypothetical protein